jgi:hypothetical protein
MGTGLDIQNLPDNVDELKTLLVNYYNRSQTLEEENQLLRRLRFAHKSEKWTNEDKMQASLFDEAEITAGEAPLQVLKEPGRANTAKSYMWLFRGGTKERPVVLYNYRPT